MRSDKHAGHAARRIVTALVSAAAVFGCTTMNTSSNFQAVVQNAGAPKGGMSRVVLYPTREADSSPIQLDGILMGELKPGTFMYRDVSAGPHELVAESAAFPALSRRSFVTVAGRTYYFRVSETAYA